MARLTGRQGTGLALAVLVLGALLAYRATESQDGRPAPDLKRGNQGPAPSGEAPGLAPAPSSLSVPPRAVAPLASEEEPSSPAKDAPDAAQALAAIRADIEARRWPVARRRIGEFAVTFPDPGAAIRTESEALKEEFNRRRSEALCAVAGSRLAVTLRSRIEKRCADQRVPWREVQMWLRKESSEEAFESLTEELRVLDPEVPPDEAMRCWVGRPRSDTSWLPVPWTFLTAGPGEFPARTTADIERWWERATTEERVDACFAVIVEKSGLFEVEMRDGVRRAR